MVHPYPSTTRQRIEWHRKQDYIIQRPYRPIALPLRKYTQFYLGLLLQMTPAKSASPNDDTLESNPIIYPRQPRLQDFKYAFQIPNTGMNNSAIDDSDTYTAVTRDQVTTSTTKMTLQLPGLFQNGANPDYWSVTDVIPSCRRDKIECFHIHRLNFGNTCWQKRFSLIRVQSDPTSMRTLAMATPTCPSSTGVRPRERTTPVGRCKPIVQSYTRRTYGESKHSVLNTEQTETRYALVSRTHQDNSATQPTLYRAQHKLPSHTVQTGPLGEDYQAELMNKMPQFDHYDQYSIKNSWSDGEECLLHGDGASLAPEFTKTTDCAKVPNSVYQSSCDIMASRSSIDDFDFTGHMNFSPGSSQSASLRNLCFDPDEFASMQDFYNKAGITIKNVYPVRPPPQREHKSDEISIGQISDELFSPRLNEMFRPYSARERRPQRRKVKRKPQKPVEVKQPEVSTKTDLKYLMDVLVRSQETPVRRRSARTSVKRKRRVVSESVTERYMPPVRVPARQQVHKRRTVVARKSPGRRTVTQVRKHREEFIPIHPLPRPTKRRRGRSAGSTTRASRGRSVVAKPRLTPIAQKRTILITTHTFPGSKRGNQSQEGLESEQGEGEDTTPLIVELKLVTEPGMTLSESAPLAQKDDATGMTLATSESPVQEELLSAEMDVLPEAPPEFPSEQAVVPSEPPVRIQYSLLESVTVIKFQRQTEQPLFEQIPSSETTMPVPATSAEGRDEQLRISPGVTASIEQLHRERRSCEKQKTSTSTEVVLHVTVEVASVPEVSNLPLAPKSLSILSEIELESIPRDTQRPAVEVPVLSEEPEQSVEEDKSDEVAEPEVSFSTTEPKLEEAEAMNESPDARLHSLLSVTEVPPVPKEEEAVKESISGETVTVRISSCFRRTKRKRVETVETTAPAAAESAFGVESDEQHIHVDLSEQVTLEASVRETIPGTSGKTSPRLVQKKTDIKVTEEIRITEHCHSTENQLVEDQVAEDPLADFHPKECIFEPLESISERKTKQSWLARLFGLRDKHAHAPKPEGLRTSQVSATPMLANEAQFLDHKKPLFATSTLASSEVLPGPSVGPTITETQPTAVLSKTRTPTFRKLHIPSLKHVLHSEPSARDSVSGDLYDVSGGQSQTWSTDSSEAGFRDKFKCDSHFFIPPY